MVIICMPRQRPRVGDLVLAGVAGSFDHSIGTAGAEAAGNHDAAGLLEEGIGCTRLVQILGVDPLDLDVAVVVEAGVFQGFLDGDVGIGQVDVFADEGDGEAGLGGFHSLRPCLPNQ